MDPQCRCHRLHQPKSADHRARIAAGVRRYHARAKAALALVDTNVQA
jgi:hypothetical protein